MPGRTRYGGVVPPAMSLLLLAAIAAAFNPPDGDYTREQPTDIRLISWNTNRRILQDPGAEQPTRRILNALDPDIIFFQEIVDSITLQEFRNWLTAAYPLPPGNTWSVQFGIDDSYNRCAIASRFPLLDRRTDTDPPSELRGVVIARADLPDDIYTADLYMMCVHLKAGGTTTDAERRQYAADAMMAWIRDGRTPGGVHDLPPGIPILYGGDVNLRTSSVETDATFRLGDIVNNDVFGSDFTPDWDASPATPLLPADPFTSDTDTFPTGTSDPTQPFDRLYYTDSVMNVGARFVFNTQTIPSSARNSLGVQFADSEDASDHLLIVMDARLPLPSTEPPVWMIY